MSHRKKTSIILNFMIASFSILGVLLNCIFATRDGYSHWHKRLLYFTNQSNIWIALVCLTVAILSIVSIFKKDLVIKNWIYILKYIFTVSITITGLIFCGLLAPFAGDYNAWTLSSILVHVVVPVLSIVDYFINDDHIMLKKWHIALPTIPPLIYFIFSLTLSALRVDFGRGDNYPYFFMNFYSEVGLFGFSNSGPTPEMGSFYWVVLILGLIIGLSFLYYRLNPSISKAKSLEKKNIS